jgi:hypothetical protein
VFFNGDACRRWFKLPADVWNALEHHLLPHEGEFLYLSSVGDFSCFP